MKHKLIRSQARAFAETELAPIAAEIDRQRIFPRDVIARMRGLNYFGLQVPKEYGGAALDSISAAIVVEELSRVCAAVGLCVTVHNGVAVYPLLQFAGKSQKEKYLPPLAAGEVIGAFSLTEANAGSDAGSVETTAVKRGAEYVLNGTKIFVTNGGVCDVALIFALTSSPENKLQSSVFIVESGFPDFCGANWRTSAACAPIPSLPCFWRTAAAGGKSAGREWRRAEDRARNAGHRSDRHRRPGRGHRPGRL